MYKVTTISTPSDCEALICRSFQAEQQAVFSAFIEPELVKQWMTGPEGWYLGVCEIDAQPGGNFRYEWHHEDGRSMGMSGIFREVLVPEKTVHTEVFDEDWTGGETLVTTTFSEQGNVTTVKILVRYSSKEARDAALATPMADGMEQGYKKLDKIL